MIALLQDAVTALTVYFLVTAAIQWFLRHLEWRQFCYEQAAEHLDEFYKASQKLIKDREVPSSVVLLIDRLADHAGTPAMAGSYTTQYREDLKDMQAVVAKAKRVAESSVLMKDIGQLTRKQSEVFSELCCRAMLASAYTTPIFAKYHLDMWKRANRRFQECMAAAEGDAPAPQTVKVAKPVLQVEKTTKPVPKLERTAQVIMFPKKYEARNKEIVQATRDSSVEVLAMGLKGYGVC